MLLMVKRSISRGICQALYRYAKGNNKFIKDYDKNKESLYLNYCNENNSYGWAISQKLPLNELKIFLNLMKAL